VQCTRREIYFKILEMAAIVRIRTPHTQPSNELLDDHHFHYGYFIHTAALIAQIDEILGNGCQWLDNNRGYIDLLVRDVSE
jgi:endoglucanase Acf2